MILELLWWYWIVIGVLLLLLEMMSGTLVSLWLGSSALITGVIVWSTPVGLVVQLLIWAGLSVMMMLAWRYWWRSPSEGESAGQAHHNLETVGTVISEISPHQRGRVKFETPVSGDTEWSATATETIALGEQVTIVEIKGQLLIVQKYH